jgi:hypothetical protein
MEINININKSISITGKHNIDKINNINTKDTDKEHYKAKRTHMETLDDSEITHKLQIDMINKLYTNYEFDLKSLLEKELERKINGYKAQDIKKDIYDSALLITLDDIIEKLMSIKLRCFYCKLPILILYKNVREPTQWTLDRIDNDKCHSKENTIVSCLKCNLQRRVTNIDKFTFTKHLKIKKV